MTYDVISDEKFEEARLAYAEAWEAQDRQQHMLRWEVPGARSTAGLKAALLTLGIKVEETT